MKWELTRKIANFLEAFTKVRQVNQNDDVPNVIIIEHNGKKYEINVKEMEE